MLTVFGTGQQPESRRVQSQRYRPVELREQYNRADQACSGESGQFNLPAQSPKFKLM